MTTPLLTDSAGELLVNDRARDKRMVGLTTAGVAAILAAASIQVLIYPRGVGPVAAAAIWGLLLSLSFVGWGWLTARWLFPGRRPDLALLASWGLGLTVFVGGLLCMVNLARRPMVLLWIFLGLAAVARLAGGQVRALRPWWQSRRDTNVFWRRWPLAIGAALLLLETSHYLGAASQGNPNPADDWIAYIPLARMILDTGTFVDPFSVRRLMCYGGQSYLQALTSVVIRPLQIHFLDDGICHLLTIALLVGSLRKLRTPAVVVTLMLTTMLIMTPETRINSASAVSGLLLVLAMFRTARWLDEEHLQGTPSHLIVGLLAAAFCTLRMSFVPVAAIFVLGIGWFESTLEGRSLPWRRRLLATLQYGLWSAAFSLPWAILEFRSNHTFIFPLFKGYYHTDFVPFLTESEPITRIKFFVSAIFNGDPLRTILLFALAGPALIQRGARRPLTAMGIACLLGFLMLVYNVPEADSFTISRYTYPFTVGYALVAGLVAAEQWNRGWRLTTPARLAAPAVIIAAMAIQIYDARGGMAGRVSHQIDQVTGTPRKPSENEAQGSAETDMQKTVPPKETLFVMIERPYLLDYGRNRIWHLDLPSAVSAPPGMPIGKGAEALASYLMGQGIRYFAFVNPDKAQTDIYNRAHWKKLQLPNAPSIWRRTAPAFLGIFDDVSELRHKRRALFDDDHLTLVDLATPPA